MGTASSSINAGTSVKVTSKYEHLQNAKMGGPESSGRTQTKHGPMVAFGLRLRLSEQTAVQTRSVP